MDAASYSAARLEHVQLLTELAEERRLHALDRRLIANARAQLSLSLSLPPETVAYARQALLYAQSMGSYAKAAITDGQ